MADIAIDVRHLTRKFEPAAAGLHVQSLRTRERFEVPARHEFAERFVIAADEDAFIATAAVLHRGGEARVELDLRDQLLVFIENRCGELGELLRVIAVGHDE